MNIVLYTNTSPQDFVTKIITEVASLDGSLRDGCDLLGPVFDIAQAAVPSGVNYAYVPDFGRYYFASIKNVRTGLWEIDCDVDPLMSWASQLRNCSGIAHRSEDSYNVMIDDGSFRAYADPAIVTKEFPNGFSAWEYLLAVAGGANSTT